MSRAERVFLLVALALGAFVRFLPVLGPGGPVGDGGLFLAMVDDVRAAGLTIPPMTTYNSLDIPFVYPPLAIWLTAALGELTGAATLDLLRWLPPLLATLTLAAFAMLAWRCLPPLAATLATGTYALMPHAYDWLVAGGGLTRGLGLGLALLAMAAAAGALGRRREILATGVFLGLAALSHPQAALFGAFGMVVLSATQDRGWPPRIAAIAGISILVVSPWAALTVATHGVDVLTAAGNRFEPHVGLIRLLNLEFAGAPFMNVFVVASVVGLIVSVAHHAWRLPVLLLLTYLVGAGGGEFLGAVPWSLLAGVGGAAIAGLVRTARPSVGPTTGRVLRVAFAAVVLFLAIIGSIGSFADQSSKLQPVGGADRLNAMRWAEANLPAGVAVLVPTSEVWGDDEISEWFPAVAGRRSIGTVQGSEWLGAEGFEAQLRAHEAILDCAGDTAGCYREIDPEAAIFIPKGHVAGPFSPEDCCPALRATLEDEGYEILYDGPGATIAQQRP